MILFALVDQVAETGRTIFRRIAPKSVEKPKEEQPNPRIIHVAYIRKFEYDRYNTVLYNPVICNDQRLFNLYPERIIRQLPKRQHQDCPVDMELCVIVDNEWLHGTSHYPLEEVTVCGRKGVNIPLPRVPHNFIFYTGGHPVWIN